LQSNPLHNKSGYSKQKAGSSSSVFNRAQVSHTLILVVKSWKAVSAANKLAWAAAAPNFPTTNKLGVPVKPSGYHCYVHLNYAYYLNHASLLSSPPAVEVGVLPPSFSITTMSAASIVINISPAIPSGYQGYLLATAPISAGVKPDRSSFTTIDYFTTGSSGSETVTSQYAARYGAPVTGNVVWLAMYVSSLATGLKGEFYIVGLVVS
jgi:hypothetical protein